MTSANSELHELAITAYHKAIAEHSDLGLYADAYCARIREVMAKCLHKGACPDEQIRVFRTLHTSELYLSGACAHGSDAAWTRLRLLYRNYICEVFRWLHRIDTAEESAESLISDLFLPDRSGQSRIASYDGRSSLSTWLRVVISNRVINERYRTKRDRKCVSDFPDVPDRSSVERLETRLRALRYLPLLKRCLPEACRCLTAQETLILLWRFDHDLQLGRIAQLMSIHQSTVTRQMEKALRRLRNELEALLANQYNLDPGAIRECMAVVVDSPGDSVSILRLIREIAGSPDRKPPATARSCDSPATAVAQGGLQA